MTVQNGKCLKVTSPLAGCFERQRLGFGACLNPLVNCDLFNLITNNCERCLPSWYPDFRGECTIKDRVCEVDETSVMGYCMVKPSNCKNTDSKGLCDQCNDGYRLSHGACYQIHTCPENQYRTSQGVCVDVAAGCKIFNPTSGVCLFCKDDSPAVEGLCCPSGLYSFGQKCISAAEWKTLRDSADRSIRPTCVSHHPTMRVCIECNGNFKPNPVNPLECH